MYLFNIDAADRFGMALAQTRTTAGISRRKMSEAIGVSESTIKAWEAGNGSPTLSILLKWFHEVGESPFSYLLEFCWPKVFHRLGPDSTDTELRNALIVFCNEVAGPREIQKINYLINGEFGGSWSGVLDMFCAHAHTSLNSRYKIADIIHTSFELSLANNQLNVPSTFGFDNSFLLDAIVAARGAMMSHKQGYTMSGFREDNKTISSTIIRKARIEAGISTGVMAKALGKSERTIRNWEENTEPTFLDMYAWFHILNKSMWTYMRSQILTYELVEFSDEVINLRNELVKYFSTVSMPEIRKFCFLIFAKHGSNWHSLLELMIEHVCSPLSQHVISARSVMIGYQIDLNDDHISSLKEFQPDIENLNKCIEAGTRAAKAGQTSF